MDLATIIANIICVLDKKYAEHDDCIDIKQLRKICALYNTKKTRKTTGRIDDIEFSTPDYSKIDPKKCKDKKKTGKNNRVDSDLNTPEFKKVYTLFVKIVYTCFELNITILDDTDDAYVLKNNYCLLKAIKLAKKKLVIEHIDRLSKDKKTADIDIDAYEKYASSYISKLKICDKLIGWIDLFEKEDNLFNLILPYFYTYNKYIEEYEG